MREFFRQSVIIGLSALLCTQIAACHAWKGSGELITQSELVSQIETGTAPLILDVRSVQEYQEGHIPGAVNINFRELEQRINEIQTPKSAPIVVYCERGIRANVAETTLQEAGFTSIFRLEGDISSWRNNNLPLEPSSISLIPNESPKQPVTTKHHQTKIDFQNQWIINAHQAQSLIDEGATVLDARGPGLFTMRIHGASVVSWKQFSPQDSTTKGRLLKDDQKLTQQLQALGISNNRPIVVFADLPNGWGEDGRIVWMLRTLGHPKVVMVDGGYQALVNEGVSLRGRSAPSSARGDFVVNRDVSWDIERDQLQAQLDSGTLVIIDTREPREFLGATPYGEQRGGHIPKAVNVYFKEFLTDEGKLLPKSEILAKLRRHNITPETQVVVYCTGGIRSGWMASVLAHFGFQVKNYAGSMWEWSASPATQFPLTTQ